MASPRCVAQLGLASSVAIVATCLTLLAVRSSQDRVLLEQFTPPAQPSVAQSSRQSTAIHAMAAHPQVASNVGKPTPVITTR